MKKVFIISVLFFLVGNLIAQMNTGIDYFLLGDYDKAQGYIGEQLANDPATANFYLGEIAFKQGDLQGAQAFYNKGLAAAPDNALNQVGLAKVQLKTNEKVAETTFSAIQRKHKKDVGVVLAIGRAYLDNNLLDKAQEKVEEAKKINKTAPEIYILEGDVLASAGSSEKKLGEAGGKYEMSIYFNPEFCLGYVKVAQVYEHINSALAIEKLKAVVEKYPDYIVAYDYLGRLYTQNGFYPQAIDMYKVYFNLSDFYTVDDIEKYSRALYFTDNFAAAEEMVNKGLQKSPEHFVLNRYLMYIKAKTKDVVNGEEVARNFFSLRNGKDTVSYIPQDYTMYAMILKNDKRYDEALDLYEKAIDMEPYKLERYTEAADLAKEKKDFGRSAGFYQRFMDKKAELHAGDDFQDDLVDINTLGYYYYSAGATIGKNPQVAEGLMKDEALVHKLQVANPGSEKDSLQTNVNYFSKFYSLYSLHKADSVFDILIARAPESYSGYRLKALTQHAINPDTQIGLAKPYYEKTVEVITERGDDLTTSSKSVLLEAYNYLGYYYYMNDDKPNTIVYWNKVLEIDPDNKNAKLILEDVNK